MMPSVDARGESERTDGLPTVIIEAMSLGKPVIGTNVSAIPELVLDNETGFLVTARDVEGLANAIEKLITNPDLRKTMGANALAMLQKEFDAQKAVKQLLTLFLGDSSLTQDGST